MTAMIYCPFPDVDSARAVGGTLLDEALIGCINISDTVQSLYVWNGERGEATECATVLKTHEDLLPQAIRRLEELHPYDTPTIMGWPCAAGAATAFWLSQLISDRDERK